MKQSNHIHIFMCVNKKPEDHPGKSCGRQNSEQHVELLKNKIQHIPNLEVKITKSLCLGKCGKGPAAIIYPEGQYIKMENKHDIEKLVSYLEGKNDINDIII